MRFLVVGAGGQGAPCASILSRDPDVSEVVLVDIDEDLLERVSQKIGSSKVTTMRVDAGNLNDLLEAAKGVDAVINLTLPRFNLKIMEAAVKSGAHYVDTALGPAIWNRIIEKKPLQFDKEFKEAGLTAVIACGGTPGITNVMIRYVCDKLDSVDKIRVVMGGKPIEEPEDIVEAWDPGWSPDVAIDDYAAEPVVFEDGEYKHYPPFSGAEEYRFPDPVGPLLVSWHIHEEAITPPRFIGKGVRHVDFRYPVDKIVGSLVKLGLTSYDPVDVKGVKVAPRDVLLKLVRHPVNAFLTEDESTVTAPASFCWFEVIEVEGTKADDKIKYTLTQGDAEDIVDERLEMYRRLGTTRVFVAAPAIVAAKMCIEGNAGRGVIAPECLDPVKFLRKMADMGVPIEFQEIISMSLCIS